MLWEAGAVQGREDRALKLSDIHNRVCRRREQAGESAPAPTTVSTYLRSAAAKGLLAEVRLVEGRVRAPGGIRTRGALSGARSPQTAYQAAHAPGAVFRRTFQAIAHTDPPDRRRDALIDFARALGLPPDIVRQLEHLVSSGDPS